MPRYQLRNTATNERLDIEGALPIDVAALVKNGTYKIRAMSEEAAGEIVVDADATIATLSPADGAIQVPINANLVMTFTGAMKRQGTVDLRAVGGALIESFDLATEGTWSSGDAVWTGNPATDFPFGAELCVRWSGLEDFKGNELADNTGDTLWNFRVQALGLDLIEQVVSTSTFQPTKDVTISAQVGDNLALVLAAPEFSRTITSLVVDPGGPNETTCTIRSQGIHASNLILLAEVTWPVAGARTVRATWSSGSGAPICVNVFNRRAFGYVDVSAGSFIATNPQVASRSINTLAGDRILFAAMLDGADAPEILAGLNRFEGAPLVMPSGTRVLYTGVNDEAVGGTPELFSVRWPDVVNRAGYALVGVYR